MSWQTQLKGDSLTWLLEHQDPGVRYLARRDLLDLPPDDPDLEVTRALAHRQGPIATVLEAMHPDGYWAEPGPGYNPKYRSTVWALILLAQLGASDAQDERISRACGYLLDQALTKYGQFSASGTPSGTADCLQGNLCAALLELGYADERLELAFEWLARSITGEGVAPLADRQAELRFYAGKCGPVFACGSNNGLPCAWGGVKDMLAIGKFLNNLPPGTLPPERLTPLVERARQAGVDFLLGVDPAEAAYPAGWSDKPSRNWWKFGFPVFYVTDLLQNVEALARCGYALDPRLDNALQVTREKQDADGRWPLEYDYSGKTWVEFGPKKQASPWVTLRALWVLKRTYA